MIPSESRTRDGTSAANLLLQVWTSPAFPVGAFAYSHGIEWAVEAGDISDAASLRNWLVDLVEHGAPRNDAILFAQAWRAAAAGNASELGKTNELALALATSRERYLETSAQGNAFVAAARSAWACAALDCLVSGVERSTSFPHGEEAAKRPSRTTNITSFDSRPSGAAQDEGPEHTLPLAAAGDERRNRPIGSSDVAYPIAFAAAAAGHGIDLRAALEAFLLAFTANLISAAVRLGAIGQTDGQRVTAELVPDIRALAGFAAGASLDDLGGAAFRSDLAAMQHETQYSRLFRS